MAVWIRKEKADQVQRGLVKKEQQDMDRFLGRVTQISLLGDQPGKPFRLTFEGYVHISPLLVSLSPSGGLRVTRDNQEVSREILPPLLHSLLRQLMEEVVGDHGQSEIWVHASHVILKVSGVDFYAYGSPSDRIGALKNSFKAFERKFWRHDPRAPQPKSNVRMRRV